MKHGILIITSCFSMLAHAMQDDEKLNTDYSTLFEDVHLPNNLNFDRPRALVLMNTENPLYQVLDIMQKNNDDSAPFAHMTTRFLHHITPLPYKKDAISEPEFVINGEIIKKSNPLCFYLKDIMNQTYKDQLLKSMLHLCLDVDYKMVGMGYNQIRTFLACALYVGADPNVIEHHSHTLYTAVENNDYPLATYAISKGSTVYQSGKYDGTVPLLNIKQNVPLAKLLVGVGAKEKLIYSQQRDLSWDAVKPDFSVELLEYFLQDEIIYVHAQGIDLLDGLVRCGRDHYAHSDRLEDLEKKVILLLRYGCGKITNEHGEVVPSRAYSRKVNTPDVAHEKYVIDLIYKHENQTFV